MGSGSLDCANSPLCGGLRGRVKGGRGESSSGWGVSVKGEGWSWFKQGSYTNVEIGRKWNLIIQILITQQELDGSESTQQAHNFQSDNKYLQIIQQISNAPFLTDDHQTDVHIWLQNQWRKQRWTALSSIKMLVVWLWLSYLFHEKCMIWLTVVLSFFVCF